MSSTDAIVNLQIVNDSNIKIKSPAKTSKAEFSMHLKGKKTKDEGKKSLSDFSALGFMNVVNTDSLIAEEIGENIVENVVASDSVNDVVASNNIVVTNDIVASNNFVVTNDIVASNNSVVTNDIVASNNSVANDNIPADMEFDYDNKLVENIESLVNMFEEFQAENLQIETPQILDIDKTAFEQANLQDRAQMVFDSVKTLIAQYTDADELLTKISDDPKQAVVELLELFEPIKVVENNVLGVENLVSKIGLADDSPLPVKEVDGVEEKINQIVMSDEAELVEIKNVVENNSLSQDFSGTSDEGDDKKATSHSEPVFNAKEIINGPNNEVRSFEYHIKDTAKMSDELRVAVTDSIYSRYHINNDGNDEFILRLTPENLGTVTIKMEKLEEGLQIRIITTDQTVKETITNQIVAIRENIEDRGIKMNNIDVVLEQHTDSSFAQSGAQHFGNQNERNLSPGTISTYTDEYDKQAIVEEDETSDNGVKTVNLYNSSVEFLA